MSKLAGRLRRNLGDPRCFARGTGSAPPTARPRRLGRDLERDPVSERLRRLFPTQEVGVQDSLPGISAVLSEQRRGAASASEHRGVTLEHRVLQTRQGGYVRGRALLPGNYLHGALPLDVVSQLDGEAALLLSGDDRLADFRPERALFFDLETTGLPGGCRPSATTHEWRHRGSSRKACAGTPLAFLIGAARLNSQGKVQLDQFLLRQQPDESAQLLAFNELLHQVDYLVSFNGRAFDRNILADRLARNRIDPTRILTLPHLDLLYPSRRLYREAFGEASLDVIERRVLGLQRPASEVRGGEVPERWKRYLATGDPRLLHAVLDHNVLDLLSLLTLGGHLARCVRTPGLCLAEPVMLAAAARLLLRRGRSDQAEVLLQHLAQGSVEDAVVYGVLGTLADQLRKTARHGEALALWRQMLRVAGVRDLQPWRAAAIALERRLNRPAEALQLVEEVLGRLSSGEGQGREDPLFPEFTTRCERLQRKMQLPAA